VVFAVRESILEDEVSKLSGKSHEERTACLASNHFVLNIPGQWLDATTIVTAWRVVVAQYCVASRTVTHIRFVIVAATAVVLCLLMPMSRCYTCPKPRDLRGYHALVRIASYSRAFAAAMEGLHRLEACVRCSFCLTRQFLMRLRWQGKCM
jgi:hypothetical protein